MAVHLEADPVTGQTVLVFAPAADIHDGPVSVVGSFNHRTPGEHVAQTMRRQDSSGVDTVGQSPVRDHLLGKVG